MGGLSTLYRTLKTRHRESALSRKEKRVAYLSNLLSEFTNVGREINANRKVMMKDYEKLLDIQEAERQEMLESAIDSDIEILEKAAKENNIKI